MVILIFSSVILFRKKLLTEYPKEYIIPGLATAETKLPIIGTISNTCENINILDTPDIMAPLIPPPIANNLITLYSSSLNPYNFAAYLIIPISKDNITGISAKGIGDKPNKEDIPAEIAIWASNFFVVLDKKSSFVNTLSKKNISYMLCSLIVDLNFLFH